MKIDRIPTPAGPCWVAEDQGRLQALRFGGPGGLRGERARLPKVRRALKAWFAGRDAKPGLDLRAATPFLRRVYRAVQRIPRGETRSYGDVARAAGRPGAARAVGQAMARNRVCLFIP